MRRTGGAWAIGIAVLAAGGPLGAAEPARPNRPRALLESWRPAIPASPALAVPQPIARDPQVQKVGLKEAIAIALENNPGLAARRLEPLRQTEGILEAQGRFDPRLTGDLSYGRTETPNMSTLGGATASIVEDRWANFHLVKVLRSGTQLSIDSNNERVDNNSAFFQLRPYYKPTLGLSLTQPLLRDFGWDLTYLVVRAAERTADAAGYQWEADLADFVQEVVSAYWAVVGAREIVGVRRDAKALADKTVEENRARVNVGLLPPVAVLEAQADAQSREAQVITADNDFVVARQRLSQLLLYSPDGTFVPRTVEPLDEAVPESVEAGFDESLQAALESRPEIKASAQAVAAQQVNERIATNQLLPRVDAVGSIGGSGLSGDRRCVRTASGVNCANPYVGRPGDAYDRLDDFPSYAIGLKVEIPIANAAAEAQAVQTRIARQQAELNHRELLSKVTLEVAQSLADLTAARKNLDVTRTARELAGENLRNQERRHEVGMATTKDLLDFQVRLTNARAEQVRAVTSYAVAVDKWRRAQGALLRHYQILVERPGQPRVPWFARF